MLCLIFILKLLLYSSKAVNGDPILNPFAEALESGQPSGNKGAAPEICSCGLKVIMNGTDSFFLKSPNYTSNPCLWEFHVLPEVSVEINCFIHGLKGTQISPSTCREEEDSFSIRVHGETEAHCNPFHHFAKFVESSAKGEGFIIYMEFKRHQSLEMEGQSFECSINGNFVGQKPSVKLSEIREFDAREKFDRDDEESSLNHPTCGQTNLTSRRLVHGEIISPEEYPWIVPLSIEGDKLCGGTILGHHWVLTSAHCIAKAHWAKIYFGVREYGFYEETQTSQEFVIHPDYDFPRHDLALIKLPQRLVFNRFVHPVCLPSVEPEERAYKGFGWSTMSDDETGASRYLRGTLLNEVDFEECRKTYGESFGRDILCTNSSLVNCPQRENSGDSSAEFSPSILGQILGGGRFVLQGVASFSSNACVKDYPLGFTRLFPHVQWIMQHIKNPRTAVQLLPIFDVLDHGF